VNPVPIDEYEQTSLMYSILHQPRNGVLETSYAKTMAELHQAILTESSALTQRRDSEQQELVQRSVQAARGSLTPFLTTPLQSDLAEVHRILADGYARLQKDNPTDLGAFDSSEGRFDLSGTENGPLKRLLTKGRQLLRPLGFSIGAKSPPIFESIFLLRGSGQLDAIERIVRDTLGIYAPTHGKHIQEVAINLFSLHNLIYEAGNSGQAESKQELVFVFEKGRIKYAPFRKELIELVEQLHGTAGLVSMTLWQRKLGLGSISEFVLRGNVPHLKAVEEAVSLIRSLPRTSNSKASILRGGLFIKEDLPLDKK
jgi:hypothetical protein